MSSRKQRPQELTEKQKTIVRRVLETQNVAAVAREFELHRQRVHELMANPLAVAYVQAVVANAPADVFAEMAATVRTSFEKAVALGDATVLRIQHRMDEDAGYVPPLDKVDAHIRLCADLYRLFQERPTEIKETRGQAADSEKRGDLLELLRDVTPGKPRVVEAEVVEPKATGVTEA